MRLNFYGVKDNVEGGFVFFFQCQNEGIMKRVVKSAMLSKEPNAFTTDLKDKAIYQLGEIDTLTGILTPIQPLFIVSNAEIRLELIREIKIAKTEAGDQEPDAKEVCDEN